MTQLCFSKDVFYDVEIILQGQVFNVALDLSSPWSWIKSDRCYQCKKDYTPLEFNKCRVNTSKPCDYEIFNKSYRTTHFLDSQKIG